MSYIDSYIGVGYLGCFCIIRDNNKDKLGNSDDSVF